MMETFRNWKSVFRLFVITVKKSVAFGLWLGDIGCSTLFLILFTLLPAIIIQLTTSSLSTLIVAVFIGGMATVAYGLAALDTQIQSHLAKKTFLFRYQYLPKFAQDIFQWPQETLDSVEGKTLIDQGYEAIYNGGNTGLEAILNRTFDFSRNLVQGMALLFIMGWANIRSVIWLLGLNVLALLLQRWRNNWFIKHKPERNRINTQVSNLVRTLMQRQNGKDIRLFHFDSVFTKYFQKFIHQLVDWQRKYVRISANINGVQVLLNTLGIAGALGWLIFTKSNISVIVTFMVAIQAFNGRLTTLFQDLTEISRNQVYVADLEKFLAVADQQRHSGKKQVTAIERITFDRVSYSVNDTEVIHDVSFSIGKGETVAIVGENGAGKTTLIKLMCGLYQPTRGEILVNDQPLREFDMDNYWRRVAVEFQDDILLHVTVAENVSGKPVAHTDRKRVVWALRQSGLANLNPDTIIGNELDSKGISLSGGQQQSLLFARVLYRKAEIVIFDEPTAALDPLAEQNFYDKFMATFNQQLNILISHRLGSTLRANQILVMQAGRIVQQGSHQALVKQKGLYQELWLAQKQLYQGKE